MRKRKAPTYTKVKKKYRESSTIQVKENVKKSIFNTPDDSPEYMQNFHEALAERIKDRKYNV